jgi:hypothetical protein
MPCNSDYLAPSVLEVACDQMQQLLDELDGVPLDPVRYRQAGCDTRFYNKTHIREAADDLARNLCARLKAGLDPTRYSLELQMWWRDHCVADVARLNIATTAASSF